MSTPPTLPHPVRADGRPERPPLVTAIAIVDLVAALFGTCLGPTWLIMGLVAEDPELVQMQGFLVAVGTLMLLVTPLGIVSAIGMLRMAPWGRTFQLVTSSIGLLTCGLGTIVNALVIAYLLQRKVKLIFSGRRVADMTAEEQQAIAGTRGGGATGLIVGIVVAGVVLLAVIIGILAAVAIPNLINAVQRGKQKRTMRDMRAVATALEAYAADFNAPPAVQDPQDLAGILVPTYATALPLTDAWTHPLEIATSPAGYVIRSGGKDGQFERPDPWSYDARATNLFVDDIVLSNGTFVRWPEGTQSGGSQ